VEHVENRPSGRYRTHRPKSNIYGQLANEGASCSFSGWVRWRTENLGSGSDNQAVPIPRTIGRCRHPRTCYFELRCCSCRRRKEEPSTWDRFAVPSAHASANVRARL